jgi:DNA-binding Lrp family transcriptional regulator
MTCVFIQIRCAPGKTYQVADALSLKEVHSESGDFDLLLKIYVPEGKDVGRYINELIGPIEGIQRTLTTLTFSAF